MRQSLRHVVVLLAVVSTAYAAAGQTAGDQTLTITTASLPVANVGKPYRVVLQARGGRPPYRWSLGEKALPPGLSLDATSGEISGTPRASGSSTVSLRARDASHPAQDAGADFMLRVVLALDMLTTYLPPPQVDETYELRLRASGGMPPYQWKVAEGKLPPGLSLEQGIIRGTPSRPGSFQLTLQVSDQDVPPQAVLRKFGVEVGALIWVRWITPPHLENGGIYGSLRVANGSNRDFDLTVIVVAVNEIHKAFTLGHQHYVLAGKSESADIPFGFMLPRGNYMVRADAVGEVAVTKQIFRAFVETEEELDLP